MNFNSKAFKIIMVTICILLGIMLYAAANNQLTILPQKIIGAIVTPIKSGASSLYYSVESFFGLDDKSYEELEEENAKLKEELILLRAKQIDFDNLKIQNEQYEEYFEIADEDTEIEYLPAQVIGRDTLDKYYSFTIDKGEKDGISLNDVVTTPEGVAGIITELGYNYSKVETVLDPSVQIGVYSSESRDTGIVQGNIDLSSDEKCVMMYLPKDTKLEEGDLIITSGLGDIFPRELVVGTAQSINFDSSGNSKYAVVEPAVDVREIKMVFVVIDF